MNTNGHDDAPQDANSDILHSTPNQRRKLQWTIATMLAAALLLWLLGFSALRGAAHAGDTATLTHRLQVAFYVLSALLFATAAYAGWYARRIFASSQYPPPGSWVLRDTRLLRGASARRRGWWTLACAAICLLMAVYAATLPKRLEHLLTSSVHYTHVPLPPAPAPSQPPPIAPPHG
jgi:hypothetical protein